MSDKLIMRLWIVFYLVIYFAVCYYIFVMERFVGIGGWVWTGLGIICGGYSLIRCKIL